MMKKIFFVFFLFFSCSPKQVKIDDKEFYEKVNDLVLSEAKIGDGFNVKKITTDGILECHATYLGDIKTKTGNTLRIINNITYSGYLEGAKRASASVNIYNSANTYIGYYYVGGSFDLPDTIIGSSLLFSHKGSDGLCLQKTSIDLSDSIPREIFIHCTGNQGDLFDFIRER